MSYPVYFFFFLLLSLRSLNPNLNTSSKYIYHSMKVKHLFPFFDLVLSMLSRYNRVSEKERKVQDEKREREREELWKFAYTLE